MILLTIAAYLFMAAIIWRLALLVQRYRQTPRPEYFQRHRLANAIVDCFGAGVFTAVLLIYCHLSIK